ncbi:MAG: restriction endonuclease [Desulfobulbus propionicus]|nr:MAG: restriction endonuclease [Desulfobulbus propionicus]PIE63987.1 MAG: restriction endonuclease [Desulfobacterales bacterium]
MQNSSLIDTGFDGHVHTSLCNHATGTMEEYVRAGIKNGLHTLCFLEHFETGIHYQRSWLTQENFAAYFREGQRLQKKYKGQIKIKLGVEAGYNPEEAEAFLAGLKEFHWDRIGLSRHFFRIGNNHYNLLSRNKASLKVLSDYGVAAILDDYFASILQALSCMERCDVVCHLDAGLRHLPEITFSRHNHTQIEAILDCLKERSVALEVNTSGFGLRGYPFPQSSLLRKALQKGITLEAGSDAHAPEQVGRFFGKLPGHLMTL